MPDVEFQYAKSGQASCQECKSRIEYGGLRYGETNFHPRWGSSTKWRHWYCVKPKSLIPLKHVVLERINGFGNLRPEDQAKIRSAIIKGRVDAVDVSNTARTASAAELDTIVALTSPNSKRSASRAGLSSSQAGPSSEGASVIEIQDSDDDENEGDETPEAVDELYCMMRVNIVGTQYYRGLVGSGEEVILRREPGNPYDRNAIQVLNIHNVQLGHIPRDIASKLAPLLDRKLVNVEGMVLEGNLQGGKIYQLPMTLKFYAAVDQRQLIEPLLMWATPGARGFPPQNRTGTGSSSSSTSEVPGASHAYASSSYTASQYSSPYASSQFSRGAGGSRYGTTQPYTFSQRTPAAPAAPAGPTPEQLEAQAKRQEALRRAAELRDMLAGLEKVDDEGRRHSLLDSLTSVDDVLSLPVHSNPPGIATGELKVDLLKHQSQALQWAIQRENPKLPASEQDKPVQFWQYRKIGKKAFYYNLATNTPQEAPPVLNRGAICADSMGLGKTLTMIALVLATKSDLPAEYSKSTLIVVPLSILSNWESQIKEHCIPGSLKSCVYYGTGRSMSAAELENYDIVITTYNVVVSEHGSANRTKAEPNQKKKKTEQANSLFNVKWKRIILDEGHSIRNPKTQMAMSVCALDGQRRWILSGTPIINSPRDLGSLLTFLRICQPLHDEEMFKRLLLRPLKNGEPQGVDLLRAIMSQSCIRRTKEMKTSDGTALVPLPPVEVIQIPVTLSEEARELYDAVEDYSRMRIERAMTAQGGFNTAIQSNALSMLTRMRQLVLHPGLIPANYLEQLQQAANEPEPAANTDIEPPVKITAADKLRLQALLSQAIEDNEECPICFGVLSDPRSTPCAHFYCLECIMEALSRDPRCPMDRRLVTASQLIEPAPPVDHTQPAPKEDEGADNLDPESIRVGPSDKINQLVHLLKLTPPNEKSLVFSQFTTFLDKIGEALEHEGIPFVRFDGKMSARRRQETLERFCVPLEDRNVTSSQSGSSRAQSGSQTQTQSQTEHQSTSVGGHRRTRKSAPGQTISLDDLLQEKNIQKNEIADDGFVPSRVDDGDTESDSDDTVESDNDFKAESKGKGKGKARMRSDNLGGAKGFSGAVNPPVMLISLKAGALGLNLTVANNVYLMDPWWQEGIESQAIDRCNRIGQKKPVHVYQLIAENTVESKVIDIQNKKKKLVQEAFKGIKNTETQRQQREARLKDLIELFGIRRQADESSR